MADAQVVAGSPVPISLQLEDGSGALFPTAEVRDDSGVLLSAVNLAHVASGSYAGGALPMPSGVAHVIVTYIVFTDAARTTESATHGRAQDVFVLDQTQSEVWDAQQAAHQSAGSMGLAAGAVAAESVVAASPAPTPTTFGTSRSEVDGFWSNHLVLVFDDSGTGLPVARAVSGYSQAGGTFTVSALPFTPSAGDRVVLMRRLAGVDVNAEVIASSVVCS